MDLLDASINSLSKQSWGKPSVKFTRSFLSRDTLEARDKAGIPGKRSHQDTKKDVTRDSWEKMSQRIQGKVRQRMTRDTRKDVTIDAQCVMRKKEFLLCSCESAIPRATL